MLSKAAVSLALLSVCECVYVFSSFYAPLWEPRILHYRVEVPPRDAQRVRTDRRLYESMYGHRGSRLIADLGSGKGPSRASAPGEVNDINLFYTYPGAEDTNRKKKLFQK